MNDPDMIALVHMNAGNLTDKPVIGKRLRPERIHLELGYGLRSHTAATSVPCDIVGPVCESSDAFLGDRSLVDPRVGAFVAILDAGAYGAAMGSNYNRRPLPPEVLVERDAWRIIRRRQTVDDMLALEEA